MAIASGINFGSPSSGVASSVGVPDLTDLPQAEAERKLRDLGLSPRSQPVAAEATEGDVFSQNPVPGSIRPRGSVVTLFIAQAPLVPPNVGRQLSDLADAVSKLETDATAESRQKAILDRIDEIVKAGSASGGGAAARTAKSTPTSP